MHSQPDVRAPLGLGLRQSWVENGKGPLLASRVGPRPAVPHGGGLTPSRNSELTLVMGRPAGTWGNSDFPESGHRQPSEPGITGHTQRCVANPGRRWSVNAFSVNVVSQNKHWATEAPSSRTLAHGKENFAFEII